MLQQPNDPIRAAADDHVHAVAHRLYSAWLSARDPDQLVAALRPLADELVLAWRAGAQVYAPIHKDFRVQFIFDRLAPQNEKAAEDWAAQLVREIGEDLRTTLNATVQDGVRRGLGPEEMAANIRDSIGLTRFQARAVQNYRQALEANSRHALGYRLRDRRFDATTEQAIVAGTPLSREQIEARVARYRQRYLAYRAYTIARYETLFASNAGAMAAVQSTGRPAIKNWLLAPDERVCTRCRSVIELQPDGVPLNQPFRWEDGKHSGNIHFAPLHPDC